MISAPLKPAISGGFPYGGGIPFGGGIESGRDWRWQDKEQQTESGLRTQSRSLPGHLPDYSVQNAQSTHLQYMTPTEIWLSSRRLPSTVYPVLTPHLPNTSYHPWCHLFPRFSPGFVTPPNTLRRLRSVRSCSFPMNFLPPSPTSALVLLFCTMKDL